MQIHFRKPDEDGSKIWAQISESNNNETNKYAHTRMYSYVAYLIASYSASYSYSYL